MPAGWPHAWTGMVTHVHARTHISGRSFEGVPLIVVPSSLFRMLSLLVIICKPNFGVIKKRFRVKASEIGTQKGTVNYF